MIDLGEGAWIAITPRAIPDHELRMARLRETLPLRAETLHICGREITTPRRTSWHGDAAYTYSGRRFEPAPWTPELLEIRELLEQIVGVRFNSVLANEYRDGRDSMGWHADDEPELGPLIASVSLGAPRRFAMRHRRKKERREHVLGEGDLFVMGGTTQRRWQHSVPKTAKPVGPRLNLTFRVVR